jgi:tetratricopeptide (TPR) repeat protein
MSLKHKWQEDAKPASLKCVLALMKCSFYDPDVLYKFRDVLLDESPRAIPKVKADVKLALQQTWQHYYQLDKEKDIAFEIGRVFYGMREYKDALDFYQASVDEMGKHHVTYHNMGLCYYSMQRLEEAIPCFQCATELNPNYSKALTWLDRVKNELRKTAAGHSDSSLSSSSTTPMPPPIYHDHQTTMTTLTKLPLPQHDQDEDVGSTSQNQQHHVGHNSENERNHHEALDQSLKRVSIHDIQVHVPVMQNDFPHRAP